MRQTDKAPERGTMPLYRQLQESFIADIRSGKLKPGQVVPSTYSLTEQFGISRVTAVRCYEELKALGFLTARRGGSTTVNPALNFDIDGADDAAPVCEKPPRALVSNLQRPPIDLVPFKSWMRTAQSVIDGGSHSVSLETLKAAICRVLRLTRKIDCRPEQMILFDSKSQALNFLVDCLIDKGDAVNAEFHCDERLLTALLLAGADLNFLTNDREGAVLDLPATNATSKLLAVSPNAQLFSGIVMSERRRNEILRFAYENYSTLLEDDGLALLRFGKAPEPSLFHQFKNVVHLGSFGAYLAPLTNVSYLIVSQLFAENFAEQISAVEAIETRFEHAVLAQFLKSGQFEQQIFRQRSLLAKARQETLEFVLSNLREVLSVGAGNTGYELLLRFHSRFDMQELLQLLSLRDMLEHVFSSSDADRLQLSIPVCAPAAKHAVLREALLALRDHLLCLDEQKGTESFQPLQAQAFNTGVMVNPVCA